MRKVLVIAALLAVMLALGTLQTEGLGEGNVLTLAAIGFVVLAAYASAELGNAWSLPRVTGYILAGTILGPSVSNILSGDVVAEMRMFNTLALGLIATSAGLELDIRQLVPLSRTLVLTTLLKIVLSGGFVALALFGVAQLVELPYIDNPTQLLALAMVMGALSIGTSPSITLAVLSETQAKGRLTDLVLGAAVFKDFVVVVCLAMVGAVVQSLLSPGQALQAAVVGRVVEELGGSLLAGIVLGGILIAYVRFVGAEMLLFVAAMILVVAEMARAFHLELLLVFITAGFVVRNFSKYAHELAAPLELVALPVFVVFFTNAGAGVDLRTTWQILPIALTACATRAVAYYVSAKFGSRWGNEPKRVARNAWLAYLPQAGVTLGLVGLAAEQHPQIREAISTTGMAVVSLNLFIGPIVLRRALSGAGELPEQQHLEGEQEVNSARRSSDPPRELDSPARRHPELRALRDALTARVHAVIEQFKGEVSANLPELPALTSEPEFEGFKRFVHLHRNACRGLFDELILTIVELPSEVGVPVSRSELLPVGGESRWLRFRLWLQRLRLALPGTTPQRRIPARLVARLSIEPAFAELARQAFEAGIHQRLWESSPGEQLASGAPDHWRLLERGLDGWSRLLDVAGTARCRTRQLRFSSVEPAIRRTLEALDESKVDYWAQRLQAVWGSHVAERELNELGQVVESSLQVNLVQRATAVRERLSPAVQGIVEQLESMKREASDITPDALPERLREWRRSIEEDKASALDELSRELRASATVRELTSQLKAAVAKLPDALRCLQLREDRIAAHGDVRRVELRALAERNLIRALIPAVDQATRAISSVFAQLPRRLRDVLEPSWNTLEALAEADNPQLSLRIEEELDLMVHRVNLLERRAERQIKSSVEQMELALSQALDRLRGDVVMVRTLREPTARLLQRWKARLGQYVAPWVSRFEQSVRATTSIADASDLRRSLQVLQGDPVPETIRRWFSQAPVRDERIFTAHRDILERIVDDEAAWLAGTRTSVLVRGNLGSGKSSLLNMCELELRNPRVLRFDGEGPEQVGSFFDTLALSLGCSPRDEALMRQLQLQRPVVLLDNLDVWLGRSVRRVEELERLMVFISKTQSVVFWVAAIENTTLALCEELVGMAEAFTRIVECRALTVAEMKELLEARRVRAGMEVQYERTWMGRVLGRLGIGSDRELFLRHLVQVSQGNPARAIANCVRVGRLAGANVLLSTERLRDAAPRVGQVLSTAQLAVLALLVRAGPLDENQMRRALGMSHQHLQRHLSFLLGAGLLNTIADRQSYEVDEDARWPIVLELKRLGALQ